MPAGNVTVTAHYKTAPPIGTAPQINGQTDGTDTINLTAGYLAADAMKDYTVTGTPTPTQSVDEDNDSTGATFGGGTLSIPTGLGVGTYTIKLKAENLAGIATMTVTVKVNSAPNPTSYTVTYAAGGATSGRVPVDAIAYTPRSTVTVLGNANSLAKAGHTFIGWHNSLDGRTYIPGQTFTITRNVTLTAQWAQNQPAPGPDPSPNYT